MATIRSLYESKKITAKRNNTFLVAFGDLFMEPGYNIRDGEIDEERVKAFCQSFLTGEYVPAIGVDITDSGLRVNDGQHRYLGAEMAVAKGKNDLMLEVYDVTSIPTGKRIAIMLNANDGTPTPPVKRAEAYARMKAEGMTNAQIAEEAHRSPSDVANFLALAACSDNLKAMVKAGTISYVMAIEMHREHGEEAETVAAEGLAAAKEDGKGKVTKKYTKTKQKPKQEPVPGTEKQQPIGKDKISRIAELASQIDIVTTPEVLKKSPDSASLTLKVNAGVWRELQPLIDEYLGDA